MAQRRGPVIAGAIAAGVLVGIPLLAWSLRSVIATSVARERLAEAHVSCDDRFEVSLSAGLGEATIGPTRCAREGGVLEAIELLGDLTISLDGTEPESVRADSVRLVLRADDVRGSRGWARALSRVNLERPLAAVIKSLSELSTLPIPQSDLARVELVRGGEPLGRAEDVTLTPGDSLGVEIGRAHFAVGPMDVGQLDLTDVRGTATRDRVRLQGRASVRAGVAAFSVQAEGSFTLEATGLSTASPRFRLDGDL